MSFKILSEEEQQEGKNHHDDEMTKSSKEKEPTFLLPSMLTSGMGTMATLSSLPAHVFKVSVTT